MKESSSGEKDLLPDRRMDGEIDGRGEPGAAGNLEECCLHGVKLSEFCEKCVVDHRTTQARDEW